MVDNTSPANTPKKGEIAPDFELADINKKPHKLSDFRGKKTILAFFPAAGSSVCTAEMCSLRDSFAELQAFDAQIIGVSVDGPEANKLFTESHHLNFPILSDYKREVIRRYDIVMSRLGPLQDYNAAKRSVFIIDESGKILYVWVTDNPLIEPNYNEIKKLIATNKNK